MAEASDTVNGAARSVWDTTEPSGNVVDDECSPTKVCKNMRGISFEGFADDGIDLRDAWKQTLAREGKLRPDAVSLGQMLSTPDEHR